MTYRNPAEVDAPMVPGLDSRKKVWEQGWLALKPPSWAADGHLLAVGVLGVHTSNGVV